MLKPLNPEAIRAPFGNYSHAVEVPAGARFVICSGQLGIAPDDSVPPGMEAQAELAFRNIATLLSSAGLSMSDLVRLNAYVTQRENMSVYMAVRDRFVSSPLPASTLMIVSGFSRPEFLVEVEAIAAKAD